MTEEEKPIRVVDRRMFTAEGELRPDFEAEERESPPKPRSAARGSARGAASERPPEPRAAVGRAVRRAAFVDASSARWGPRRTRPWVSYPTDRGARAGTPPSRGR